MRSVLVPKSYSLEGQSNRRVQVVKIDQSEDNRSIVYIGDLKVFAEWQSKLRRVLRSVKDDMECVGLKWNDKKCAVAHMNRGGLTQGAEYLKIDNAKEISRLEEAVCYKFLRVLENVKQEDKIVLQNAARCTCKGYLLFVLAG